MGTAMFYHLTRSGPDEALAQLLPRAVAQGWRIMMRSPNADHRERLDAKLWVEPAESFQPHAQEGGPHDADQPVLIGQGAAVNGARGVFLLDGAAPLDGEQRLDRLWILFDGADEAAVQAARGLWSRLTGLGMAAQYWSEETGRWVMKTEKKPAE